jgi:hypothetical protein
MAAGARLTSSCLPTYSSALAVPCNRVRTACGSGRLIFKHKGAQLCAYNHPLPQVVLTLALCSSLFAAKKQEARSFLTGLLKGGIELKDRSAGGWRSGLQRSEK